MVHLFQIWNQREHRYYISSPLGNKPHSCPLYQYFILSSVHYVMFSICTDCIMDEVYSTYVSSVHVPGVSVHILNSCAAHQQILKHGVHHEFLHCQFSTNCFHDSVICRMVNYLGKLEKGHYRDSICLRIVRKWTVRDMGSKATTVCWATSRCKGKFH